MTCRRRISRSCRNAGTSSRRKLPHRSVSCSRASSPRRPETERRSHGGPHRKGPIMTRALLFAAVLVAGFGAVSAAQAQQTVKIGLINVLSGQFADAGTQLDNGVKTYLRQK